MKLLTSEWIVKAEGDFLVAQTIYRARKNPVYDAVCFHAQQCAEKYLKAFLQESGQTIPRTHELLDLLKLCQNIDPSLEMLAPDLRELSYYAVNIRYPGESADKEEAKTSFAAIKVVRNLLRQKMGLG